MGLFTPFKQKGLELRNRIVMSPMVQFCAPPDGHMTEWHHNHYGARAVGGAPYTDADPHGQIDRVFAMARDFDVDVDFHLDLARRLLS